MFRIINFTTLIRYIATCTTFISIIGYELAQKYFDIQIPIVRILSISPWIAFLIMLGITTNVVARFIWKFLSKIDHSLYPDLNGTWEGEIVTESEKKIPTRAIIRQTLVGTQVDLHTETSKSQTLETTPATESGQYKLYYSYISKPKNPAWSAYTGCTIFDVRRLKQDKLSILELSGYYFTDRKTIGRIYLKQISKKLSEDVSYY